MVFFIHYDTRHDTLSRRNTRYSYNSTVPPALKPQLWPLFTSRWSILADCKCYRTTFCPCPCGRSGLPLRHLPSLLLDDLLHLRHLLLHLLHLLGVFFCWRPNKWRPNKWRPNKSA